MNQAIGLIEVEGLASAIKVADTMLKAANVSFRDMQKAKGMGWMVIVIEGDVGAVNASINSGEAEAKQIGKFVSSKVIARPAAGLTKLIASDSAEEKPVAKAEAPKEETPKEEAPVKSEPVKAAAQAEPKKPATETKAEVKKPVAKARSTKKEAPAKSAPKKPAAQKASPKTTTQTSNKAKTTSTNKPEAQAEAK